VRWIIGSCNDIAGGINQLFARKRFINLLTNADVSDWSFLKVNGQILDNFLCCVSNDYIDGTFITAHMQNNNFSFLFSLHEINKGKFIVANTCVLEKHWDKGLLYSLMRYNRNIELFFSQQELSLASNHLFYQSTTIDDVGKFGFPTSFSERKMFKNREKGLYNSIRESFNRVSLLFSLNDV